MTAIVVGAFAPISHEITALAERLRPSIVAVQDGQRGGGTGVVWPGGMVVTNDHVVRGDTAEIVTADERHATLTVVARDEGNDLAALRLSAELRESLPAVDVGDSLGLRVGQLVVAIGHPLGVQHAVTAGIISALPDPEAPREILRSDLHLNPGNSGGPLVDTEGRVVAINAMVAGPGTALSVPSHAVQALLALAGGTAPKLGVQVVSVPHVQALMVSDIEPGSPAEQVGLLPGDVIVSFRSPLRLRDRLALAHPGERFKLTISRAGSVFEVEPLLV